MKSNTVGWFLGALACVLVGAPPLLAQSTLQRRTTAERSHRPAQFLLISFDGTPGGDGREDGYYSLGDQLRTFSRRRGKLTLFVNAQFYMLPHSWRPPVGSRWDGHPELYQRYIDPQPRNRRAIPYAPNPEVIEQRIATAQLLLTRGDELASHSTRHYNGRGWTEAEWRTEFEEYERFMREVVHLPAPRGFRAPYLAASPNLHRVEVSRGLHYDASRATDSQRRWPEKYPGSNMWIIGVPTLRIPSLNLRAILSFDDAFRIQHLTDADVSDAYEQEFNYRYEHSRAPMVISSHGPYTGPTMRLARRVCRFRDVICGSFNDLADYLDAHPELAGQSRSDLQLNAPAP